MAQLIADRRAALKIKQATCAAEVGMPMQHYAELEDDDAPRNLSLADAMGLPPALQDELLAEWAAQRGKVLADAPHVETPAEVLEHAGALATGAGEAITFLARAKDDGVIDEDERAEARRLGNRMMAHGATLVAIGDEDGDCGRRVS